MEAARTSETSIDNYFTRQCIAEDKSERKALLVDSEKDCSCHGIKYVGGYVFIRVWKDEFMAVLPFRWMK
jgi:hypothetical protein